MRMVLTSRRRKRRAIAVQGGGEQFGVNKMLTEAISQETAWGWKCKRRETS